MLCWCLVLLCSVLVAAVLSSLTFSALYVCENTRAIPRHAVATTSREAVGECRRPDGSRGLSSGACYILEIGSPSRPFATPCYVFCASLRRDEYYIYICIGSRKVRSTVLIGDVPFVTVLIVIARALLLVSCSFSALPVLSFFAIDIDILQVFAGLQNDPCYSTLCACK